MPNLTRPAAFALLFLLLLGMALYLPGLSGPLFFDDKGALTGNYLVKIGGASFDEWRTAALSSRSGVLRRPVAMLSFAANHAVNGGFSPLALKTVNLAIHLLTAVFLYFFTRTVVDSLGPRKVVSERNLIAITAAGIWLLHPLHVSTVLYAVQRMAQLSALFVLAGMLIFMTYRQRWAQQGAPAGEVIAAGLWLLLMTLLAVLSKENGALLPWLLVVLEVCLFRGLWAGKPNRYLKVSGWVLLLLPAIAVAFLIALSPDSVIGGYRSREFTLEERLLTQARLLWRYLGWIIFPNINDMGFQHDDIPLSSGFFVPWTTGLSIVAWPVCLALALRARRSQPLLLAALLFFLVGHSMESSVLPLEMVYEHRNYLPSVVICIAFAYLLITWVSGSGKASLWYPLFGLATVLSVLLFVRVNTWSSELVLSRTNVVNHPESSRSNYFYANALLRRFRDSEQLGLTQEEAAGSLLLARHYFERMYQSSNHHAAALVLLYYLDSQFFPELQDQVDWLDKLEQIVTVRMFQASDWNAMDTLMDCFASQTCTAAPERVLALLDVLWERYPGSAQILRYRYNYLSSRGAGPEELLPLLEEAQLRARRFPWVYYALFSQLAKTGEVDQMYDFAQQWLQYDHRRYTLPRLQSLFDTSGKPAETGGE